MDYYVYALLDPRKPGIFNFEGVSFNHEPFYIGKGKNKRCYNHFRNLNNINLKTNKIKKILKTGLIPIIQKIQTNLSETVAHNAEKQLIKTIGRRNIKTGLLTNLTDGGEGISGCIRKLTELHKCKISEALKGKAKSVQHRKSLSEAKKGVVGNFLGKKHNLETRIKMSDARKGKTLEDICGSEKAALIKNKMSKSRLGNKNHFYGKTHTNETKKKISNYNKTCIGEKGKNAKTWIFTSPEGKVYTIKGNFKNFCYQQNIRSFQKLKLVSKGILQEYKGWKCYEQKKN